MAIARDVRHGRRAITRFLDGIGRHPLDKLAMADAIIYATAIDSGADLLTCDAHFAELPRVVYQAKRPQ